MITPVVYMAHPVGAPTADGVTANLARAKRWLAWLLETEQHTAFCVPWLPMVEVMPEDGGPNRARGLRDDVEIARRCDGIVLVGGRLTSGMLQELAAVRDAGGFVANLVKLGDEPPASWDFERGPIAVGRDAWRDP